MLVVYFSAAAVGVFAVTVIAAFIKTAETRTQMRQQLTLEIDNAKEQQQPAHDREPAAMISVR
jgi:hypothetical protein